MPYIEIAWIREGSRLTYITANVETLVGYTPDEVRGMDILDLIAPSHVPVVLGLMDGGQNQIASKTFSKFTLRHKAGHQVCCQMTLICHYNGDGKLTELFGAIRQLPNHRQFAEVEQWWITAPKMAHQALCESMAALFPMPA